MSTNECFNAGASRRVKTLKYINFKRINFQFDIKNNAPNVINEINQMEKDSNARVIKALLLETDAESEDKLC